MNGADAVLGVIFIRLILISTGILLVWRLWNQLYGHPIGLGLVLAYLFYLIWRPIRVHEENNIEY